MNRRTRRGIKQNVSSGSEEEDDKANNLVEKILKGGLLKSIEKVVEQQAAIALSKHVGNTHSTRRSNDPDVVVNAYSTTNEHIDDLAPTTTTRIKSEYSNTGVRFASGELLDPFDPDGKDANVEKWLAKIDQLGLIHGWSEYDRVCFMQAKLQGAARSWFNRINNYDLSWTEWKASLTQAFPQYYDYAAMLEELLARNKRSMESMTHYFRAKLALCERCDIGGEKAVSLLIHGLPVELFAGARAANCKTPQELYSRFLAGFDEYEAGSSSGKRRSTSSATPPKVKMAKNMEHSSRRHDPRDEEYSSRRCDPREVEYSTRRGDSREVEHSTRRSDPREVEHSTRRSDPREVKHSTRRSVSQEITYTTRRNERQEMKMRRCFNCQEITTHLSRDCPYPRMERCLICRRGGHLASECPEDVRM